MRHSLLEAKRQLSIDVNEVLNGTLHSEVFDDLFNYLIQFSISPNLCPLRGLVRAVVEELLLATASHMSSVHNMDVDSSDHIQGTINTEYKVCLKNITQSYVNDYTNGITVILGRQLADFKVYVSSLIQAKEVISAVRYYQFSPACSVALMRMKHCSYCGGYKKFQPCLNLCLNTLRGCFADIAELDESFKFFTAALKTLSKKLDSEFKPENFVGNQLRRFVTMAKEFKHRRDLKHLVRVTFYVNK